MPKTLKTFNLAQASPNEQRNGYNGGKMSEETKRLLLIGAGALLGSVSTIAVIKLLSRQQVRSGNKSFTTPVSKLSTNDDGNFSGPGNRSFIRSDDSNILKDEIISEQLTRNIQFFGIKSQQKVSESFVVVIGLGGVGSHAACMLLRSGVRKLRLVDFDQVSLSSLNRHAVATRDDVGISKAMCLQKHFSSIFPECEVDAHAQLYDSSSEEEILSGHPDYILDCIDNIDTKVALLAACVRRGLKVLSATGAGARADPTRIRIADIKESTIDPLSRAVRYRLKKDYGIETGIPVVFSLEKPKVKLLPFKGTTGEDENPSDYQIVPGFRVRIIPVLGTIPAIFGQVMASYVLTQLAGFFVQTEPVVTLDPDHYRVIYQRLIEHEELVYGSAEQVLVDVDEVMYIVKELWQGRSARDLYLDVVGQKMWRSVNEMVLVSLNSYLFNLSSLERLKDHMAHDNKRFSKVGSIISMTLTGVDIFDGDWRAKAFHSGWDQTKPASVSNLILLKFKEAEEHEMTSIDVIKEKEPELFNKVTAVLKRAEVDFGL